jgi:thioredoxin reductase
MFDVIIIGGGPAGLSAALLLGRCNRNILVFDAGSYRNERSYALHSYLSRDGYNPKEFLELCRKELTPYDVNFRKERITQARIVTSGFEVISESGQVYACKKLLLATGVKDELPPLEGITDFFGKSVFHSGTQRRKSNKGTHRTAHG